MPAGRPSKYDPSMCEDAYAFLAEGRTKEALAGKLGVCRDTLYEWMGKHPEFSDTIRRGEAASRQWWEDLGRRAAMGEVPGFAGTPWVMTMKNCFGYRDKVDHSHTGEGGGPIKTESKIIQVVGVRPGEAPDT